MKKSILLVLVVFLFAVWLPAFSSSAPLRIPPGDLSPVISSLTPGGKFAVYSGPGKSYLRPADEKAAVSSNGWVLTFGMENGWTMIAYEVSDGQYRFGWIEEKASSVDLAFDMVPAVTARDAIFTDDPQGEVNRLAILKKGASVTRLARMGIWAYVEAEAGGIPARGFVFWDALAYTDKTVHYADCLYPIRVNGKWGYMNYQGEIILKPQWAGAGEFRGAGYAVVGTDENSWQTGHEYTEGIINKSGAYVVEPHYCCDEGYDGYYYGGKDSGVIIYASKESEGFFDVAAGFDSGPSYGGVAPWMYSNLILVSGLDAKDRLNSYGYVDSTTGELVIPYQFDYESQQFFGRWAIVSVTDPETETSTRYLIDQTGKRLTLPKGIKPMEYTNFSEGLLPVYDVKTGLCGYADEMGAVVIDLKYNEADDFYRGVAKVKLNGEELYIDKEGHFVDAPNKDRSNENATDGVNLTLFFGNTTDWDNSCGLIDGKGTILVPLEAGYSFDESFNYGYLDFFTEGLQVLIKDGKYGFLDTAGNEAVPFLWDDASNFKNGLARVEKDGKMAYIDHNGNVVWREE